MAWIYSPVWGESHLHLSHGSDLSRTVKTIDTPRRFFCPEWTATNYPPHLFGMTCVHCEGTCSQKWTLSMAGSHARTSLLLDMEKVWQESKADFSSKSSALQKKYVRRLCSLRMSQQLELEDFEKSSEHLPLFGMTVGGRVCLPQKLEPRTLDDDGSLLPTPTANEYGTSNNGNPGDSRTSYATKGKMSLSTMARRNLWPTPVASDGPKGGPNRIHGKGTLSLSAAAAQSVLPRTGQLSPMWTEWLMGYPSEWTGLNALGMQWCQPKPGQRSKG